jgi:hypothetical protein
MIPAAMSSRTSTVWMLAKRGLRMTVASENRPTISGKAMSLHVGRRFGMFSRFRASLVDHRGADKRTPYTVIELA